jgi:hypothetical protein
MGSRNNDLKQTLKAAIRRIADVHHSRFCGTLKATP